jgi:DNA modification methylase
VPFANTREDNTVDLIKSFFDQTEDDRKKKSSLILTGDALTTLKTLPSESVHCCITSPPYWNLRNYKVAGQLGREKTSAEFIDNLVSVCREVRRVLRKDGTFFLNLGDTYSNKSLSGIPWRVAFKLQDDGWFLRQDLIWHKPNAMPESVKTRWVRAHEYLFFLTKTESHYFNIDSIREPLITKSNVREKSKEEHNEAVLSPIGKGIREWNHPLGLSPRSVLNISTRPFKGIHFATFPSELVKRCILAGSPEGGVILDPFLGSGTTLAVALELDRVGVGIDLNPEYVEIAKQRIKESNAKILAASNAHCSTLGTPSASDVEHV